MSVTCAMTNPPIWLPAPSSRGDVVSRPGVEQIDVYPHLDRVWGILGGAGSGVVEAASGGTGAAGGLRAAPAVGRYERCATRIALLSHRRSSSWTGAGADYRPGIGDVKAPQSDRDTVGQSMWGCHTLGYENVAAVPIAGPAGRGVYLAARTA